MTSLYEMAEEMLKLQAEEDIPEEVIRDTLEGMTGEFKEKVRNCARFIVNLESFAEQIKAEEKKMTERRNRLDNRADSVRQYLLKNMEKVGELKFNFPEFDVIYRVNPPSLKVDSEDSIPDKYYIEQDPKLDAKTLKADVLAGDDIEGVSIIRKPRIDIK